jgi:hypothetical protein
MVSWLVGLLFLVIFIVAIYYLAVWILGAPPAIPQPIVYILWAIVAVAILCAILNFFGFLPGGPFNAPMPMGGGGNRILH